MEQTEQKGKDKKIFKPNNIVTIPVEVGSTDFFKWWCIYLRPFIHLTNREIDVVTELLRQRHELSKSISDPAIVDTMLMTDEVKKRVIEACHITQQHFYVVMSSLRKNQIIKDNIINPRLIPNVRSDSSGVFQLLILFKKKDDLH